MECGQVSPQRRHLLGYKKRERSLRYVVMATPEYSVLILGLATRDTCDNRINR
jgi:hypothetical protein